MKWTDEAVELLKKLDAQGLSAGQISDRLGCTRNSICGKLDRLGLRGGKKMRPRPRQLTAVPPRTSDPGPRKGRHPDHVFGRPNTIKPWIPPALTPGEREFILGTPIPLSELTDHRCGCAECVAKGPRVDLQRCHWPINSPWRGEEYLFCGAPIGTKGCSYCSYHMARAYGSGTPSERRATEAA